MRPFHAHQIIPPVARRTKNEITSLESVLRLDEMALVQTGAIRAHHDHFAGAATELALDDTEKTIAQITVPLGHDLDRAQPRAHFPGGASRRGDDEPASGDSGVGPGPADDLSRHAFLQARGAFRTESGDEPRFRLSGSRQAGEDDKDGAAHGIGNMPRLQREKSGIQG